MNKNSNLIREQIDEFLDGNLSENEVDQLWAMLLNSPEDLDYLETKATLRKMSVEGRARHSENGTGKESTDTEKKQTKIAAYASYLVAATVLIVGVTFTYNTLTGPTGTSSIAIGMIEYETERSSDSVTSEFEGYLQSAISQSADGNAEEALKNLQSASSLDINDEQKAELYMLEGTVHYNADNFHDALRSFEKITSIDSVEPLEYEKAVWYMANTQIQLGLNEEARANLNKVIELDGAFSRMANSRLEQLQ